MWNVFLNMYIYCYHNVVQFLISYFSFFLPLFSLCIVPRQIVKQQLNCPLFLGNSRNFEKFRNSFLCILFFGLWLACWESLSSWFFVRNSLLPVSVTFVAMLWWSLGLPFRINHICFSSVHTSWLGFNQNSYSAIPSGLSYCFHLSIFAISLLWMLLASVLPSQLPCKLAFLDA